MAKGTTTIYKTTDRATRTPLKPGVNSGDPEGWAVPVPHVDPSCYLCYKLDDTS